MDSGTDLSEAEDTARRNLNKAYLPSCCRVCLRARCKIVVVVALHCDLNNMLAIPVSNAYNLK